MLQIQTMEWRVIFPRKITSLLIHLHLNGRKTKVFLIPRCQGSRKVFLAWAYVSCNCFCPENSILCFKHSSWRFETSIFEFSGRVLLFLDYEFRCGRKFLERLVCEKKCYGDMAPFHIFNFVFSICCATVRRSGSNIATYLEGACCTNLPTYLQIRENHLH